MINKYKKKAGVEMSLNLIIMLIIGFVVLALVIAFVTGLIGQGEGLFTDKLNELETQESNAVLNSPGAFAAGPSDFRVSRGGTKKVFVKLSNSATDRITFAPAESGSSGIIGDSSASALGVSKDSVANALTFTGSSIDLSSTCQINVKTTPLTVSAGDSQAMTVFISALNGCTPGGTFFITVQYAPDGSSGEVFETATITGVIDE